MCVHKPITFLHHPLPPQFRSDPLPPTPPLVERKFPTVTMRRNVPEIFLVAQGVDAWSAFVLGVLFQAIITTPISSEVQASPPFHQQHHHY
jgi:hypothetical protein